MGNSGKQNVITQAGMVPHRTDVEMYLGGKKGQRRPSTRILLSTVSVHSLPIAAQDCDAVAADV